MGLQNVCLVILFVHMLIGATTVESLTDELGCQRECGNITVPYPFGFGKTECSKDSTFMVVCNDSVIPPVLSFGNIPVNRISVEDGTAIVEIDIAFTCYNQSGISYQFDQAVNLGNSPFTFSSKENKFNAIGCDTFALVSDRDGDRFSTGCMTICTSETIIKDPTNLPEELTSCSGIGCCQTQFPKGLKTLNISLQSLYNHSFVLDSNPCDYGFLSATNSSLKGEPVRSQVVLDWTIGNMTCEEASKSGNRSLYICGQNTNCLDSTNGLGYRCSCKDGFKGNPYTQTGCEDIDECSPENQLKFHCEGHCKNTPGNYSCHCSFGYQGDGKIGCKLKIVLKVFIGIAASVLLGSSVLSLSYSYKKKIQERNHRKNGGLLVDHFSMKIFKEAQLEKATNDFDAQRLLGEGGNGWVYRGSLPDMIDIAVKKSKVVDQNQIEQFLNEADIVSKINHKNVVKLLGVCLESRVPMLVYEFVPNGTLYHHIHEYNSRILESWRICLRVAAETARALEYMHSLAYPPIIHRDVKSSNILLDGTYTAKVSDFGASMLIPLDRTIAPIHGQGTMGYLDPEYLQTGELTTMSDVYGFGVVLMELLSKQKPLSRGTAGEMISLVKAFTTAVDKNQFDEILKVADVTEEETEHVHLVAKLAIRCVAMPSKKRPTMTEVADVLTGLSREYSSVLVEQSVDEMTSFLDDQDVLEKGFQFELEYSK